MKKRLLSAALALAMVLTMLPLSVFAYTYASPTPVGDGTETVQYYTAPSGDSYLDENGTNKSTTPGWYVRLNVPAVMVDGKPDPSQPAKTVYVLVKNGLSVSGYYYKDASAPSDTNLEFNYGADGTTKTSIKKNGSIYSASLDSSGNVVQGNLKGNVIVIGGTIEINAVNASSLSVDVCGGTVTISQTNSGTSTTKLTSLTVTNSQFANTKDRGTITLDSSLDGLTSLSLTNTKAGAITLDAKTVSTTTTNNAGLAHSLTLNNAETGAITLNGVGTDTKETRAAQTVNITNSSVGAITVKGVNSTVTLNEVKATTAPTVAIEGTGGNLYVRGGSTLGAVTIGSGAKEATTAALSNVTVETGSTVESINSSLSDFSKELATGRNTVSISGTVAGASAPGVVNFKNAAVTVNGGQTGNITLDTGTVTVSGNRAGVGDVTLTKDATFTLSGTNCTVGALVVASGGTAATVTFNVPNDPSNTLGGTSGAVTGGYSKATIKGGTWTKPVPAVNLDASLMYQLEKTVGSDKFYTYFTSDQLGEAIIKQGDIKDNTLTKVGDEGQSKVKVTFMNGSMTWGVLTVSPFTSIPKMPTQMNSVKTPYWSDGKFSNIAGNYSVPGTGVILNAGSSVSSDVTALTGVRMKVDSSATTTPPDVKATLVGNVITLTGAVEKTDTKFDLILETDAVTADTSGTGSGTGSGSAPKEKPVEIELSLIFDPSTKALTVAQKGDQSLGNGVIIENTFTAIKLSDGTRYTFNGSGLVVRSKGILVKGLDETGGTTYPTASAISKNGIEVIVTAPGYTANDTLKNGIINLINSNGAGFDWSKSPAVKQAVNAALATVSDANVQSWINAASARARSDHRLASNADTAYQDDPQVWLVPYLEVNVTSYQPNTINPALNATLTIKWRVEIHPGTTKKLLTAKEYPNLVSKDGVYIAKTGTALTLDSDLGAGVDITFKDGVGVAKYVHQESIYDYTITSDKFTLTHAVNGNLGKIVLDTKEPLIKVGTKANDNTLNTKEPVTYFSTLQAAVDAAEDGQIVEISSSYTGSTSINMTGKARTIYVQANGKNVVVANASGSLVEVNPAGTFYTIKLNRDNNAPAAATAISVTSVTGGSGSVDKTTAAPGQSFVFTASPSTGYQAATPTASADNGTVTITASGTNKWTMTVPAGATKVTVTPRFVLNTGMPYTDVTDTSLWYFQGVKYCYDTQVKGNSLMQGDTNNQFAPTAQLTRAQMVQILWNMAGQPAVTGNCPFPDVVGTGYDWAKEPITWAAQKGYVIGYNDGKFHPEVNVSRQDMVTILYRYAKSPSVGNSSLAGYYDGDKVGDWALDAVRWATSMGILSGTNSVALNGYISGPSKAKRCEVAVTIASFYSKGYAIN